MLLREKHTHAGLNCTYKQHKAKKEVPSKAAGISYVNGSYLRYWKQIVAGVRCAKAQYQRQPYTRTEQPNFHLIFQIMWQVPCQNVEIEVQRDHCKVPVFTHSVRTAASSVERQLCVPSSPPWRRQSRGLDVGRYLYMFIYQRVVALFDQLSVEPLAVSPPPPAVNRADLHRAAVSGFSVSRGIKLGQRAIKLEFAKTAWVSSNTFNFWQNGFTVGVVHKKLDHQPGKAGKCHRGYRHTGSPKTPGSPCGN